MSQYTVTAERSGRWWVLQCVEVPGALSQVSRLSQAGQIAEAIAFVAGVDAADVEVNLVVKLPGEAQQHLRAASKYRERASEAAARAAHEQRAAARTLSDAGLTTRDIGKLMDVSFQRAHQLLSEDPVRSSHG